MRFPLVLREARKKGPRVVDERGLDFLMWRPSTSMFRNAAFTSFRVGTSYLNLTTRRAETLAILSMDRARARRSALTGAARRYANCRRRRGIVLKILR